MRTRGVEKIRTEREQKKGIDSAITTKFEPEPFIRFLRKGRRGKELIRR